MRSARLSLRTSIRVNAIVGFHSGALQASQSRRCDSPGAPSASRPEGTKDRDVNNHLLRVLGAASIVSATTAFAQSAEDHPCVQEVCIGDGIEKLSAIDWQTVAYTSERVKRIRKEDRARRAKVYPGFGADGVPSYLVVGKFDRDILRNMKA